MRNSLIISDLQIPFEHPKALEFCIHVKRHFRIADEDVYNVGDETDKQWAGDYQKDPDAIFTPATEIACSIERLKRWYDYFPQMKLCFSNHGVRDIKKAFNAGIPSQMIMDYRRVIQAPRGWQWAMAWHSDTKKRFIVEHGDKNGYGGAFPHYKAMIANGCSTAIGHHHVRSGVEYIETSGLKIWGAASGCLIDRESYAFRYADKNSLKAKLGLTVALDDGAYASWIPFSP